VRGAPLRLPQENYDIFLQMIVANSAMHLMLVIDHKETKSTRGAIDGNVAVDRWFDAG
jgi:hypothetical protein